MGSSTSTHKRHQHHWRPKRVNADNVHAVLDQYDTLILDCDGVLWSKDQLSDIPDIKEALEKLTNANKRIIFVSNNSLYSRQDYKQKILKKTGFEVAMSDVFAVNYAVAIYLKKILGVSGSIYVIGWPGLEEEVKQVDLNPIGIGKDPDPVPMNAIDLMSIPLHSDIKAVVVGFDPFFSYNKLFKAACYLKDSACHFVATSGVNSLDMHAGHSSVPLEGTFIAALTAATGRQASIVGKPNKLLFDCLKAMKPDINKERTLLVGDTLETDVLFAKNTGIDSLLVLSGSCSALDLERLVLKDNVKLITSCLPNYVIQSLGELDRLL